MALRDETLRLFNKKVKNKKQTNAQHVVCISAVSRHIFSKRMLCTCKRYLQKVHLHNPMTISKYVVCWHQKNDYFALFPPLGRMA